MNLAAAIAFATTMTLGMVGLTGLVYRNRARTQPPQPASPPLAAPRTVYEHTTAALGDPKHIDLTPPPFTWPN
jgi:hypothetical protein